MEQGVRAVAVVADAEVARAEWAVVLDAVGGELVVSVSH
jgi:hypothetical protein